MTLLSRSVSTGAPFAEMGQTGKLYGITQASQRQEEFFSGLSIGHNSRGSKDSNTEYVCRASIFGIFMYGFDTLYYVKVLGSL